MSTSKGAMRLWVLAWLTISLISHLAASATPAIFTNPGQMPGGGARVPTTDPSAPGRTVNRFPARRQPDAMLLRLPLRFEWNVEQSDRRVRSSYRGQEYSLFFAADSVPMSLTSPAADPVKRSPSPTIELKFLGANPAAQPAG